MAEIREIVCDRNGCKNKGAKTMHTFFERRSDGAGSMDDWYLQFDLCALCAAELLPAVLDILGPDKASQFLKTNKVAVREA